MANETTINVKVDVDTTGLEELSNLLDELSSKGSEAADGVSSSIRQIDDEATLASLSLDELSASAGEVNDELSGIDPTNIDGVGESASNAVGGNEELTSALNELTDALRQTGDAAKEEKEGLDEASESASNYSSMVGAVASLGLAAEFTNTANAADNYKVSMAALESVCANNGIAMESVSSAITQVTDATSIGAGKARSYFSLMMNMGVTNTQALADSMINLKAQSAITGGSVDEMSNKITRLVTGSSLSSKQLASLGLSLDQLAAKNGMTTEQMSEAWKSMTADEKLNALNNAMSENSGLLETLNATTSEQLQEVQNSWAGLEIAVGDSTSQVSQSILGLANGAILGLTSAVKNIPFASEFAGGVLAAGSLITAVDPAVKTFNNLSLAVKNGMGIFQTISGPVGKLGSALKDTGKQALTAGTNALKSAAHWLKLAATQVTTTLKNWLLAASEWAVASPILIIIIVIAALIAILIYLYFTNDQVRAAIDGFGQALIGVGQMIIDGFISVLQQIVNWFNTLWQTIQIVVTLGILLIMTFVQNVVNGFLSFITFIATLPGRVASYLLAIISSVASWASNMISRAASTASQFVSRIISGLSSLPGKVYSELSKTLSRVIEWGSQIVSKFSEIAQQAWQAFASGLGINSPGYIQKITVKEMANTAKRIPESMPTAIRNLRVYAQNMVEAYGTPTLPAPKIEGGNLPNISGHGAGGDIIDNRSFNINIDSVDSEERIQQLVEVIRKEISWDNKTAGRTA